MEVGDEEVAKCAMAARGTIVSGATLTAFPVEASRRGSRGTAGTPELLPPAAVLPAVPFAAEPVAEAAPVTPACAVPLEMRLATVPDAGTVAPEPPALPDAVPLVPLALLAPPIGGVAVKAVPAAT